MSKAFLKDDAQDEQVIVSARPPLPPGTPNTVTPRGLKLLQDELAALSAERARLQAGESDDHERARKLVALGGRHDELSDRLSSAQLVAPASTPDGVVGFGATVTVRTLTGKFAGEERRLTIVGVDEAATDAADADPDEARVAFTAPVARALMGRRVGEQAHMQTLRGRQTLEVVALEYRP